jgi:hypothetical protein
MKALSSPLRRAVRSRKLRVNSTEEIFFAPSAADSSVRVPLSKLLKDFGNQVKPLCDRRSDRLIKLALVGLGHRVGPKPLAAGKIRIQSMRHGLDAGGVDRAHSVDQAEDPVQPLEHGCGFLGLDRDAGEPRDASDVVVG